MRRRKPNEPEINVTPLVDVVLVLLIIFMVVLPQLDSGAAVDPPSARNVDPETDIEYEPFALSVTKHGDVFFERQPVPREDLVRYMREAHRVAPSRRLQIKGDKNAPYRIIRDVFRECQQIGFLGVGLQVGERKG